VFFSGHAACRFYSAVLARCRSLKVRARRLRRRTSCAERSRAFAPRETATATSEEQLTLNARLVRAVGEPVARQVEVVSLHLQVVLANIVRQAAA